MNILPHFQMQTALKNVVMLYYIFCNLHITQSVTSFTHIQNRLFALPFTVYCDCTGKGTLGYGVWILYD